MQIIEWIYWPVITKLLSFSWCKESRGWAVHPYGTALKCSLASSWASHTQFSDRSSLVLLYLCKSHKQITRAEMSTVEMHLEDSRWKWGFSTRVCLGMEMFSDKKFQGNKVDISLMVVRAEIPGHCSLHRVVVWKVTQSSQRKHWTDNSQNCFAFVPHWHNTERDLFL